MAGTGTKNPFLAGFLSGLFVGLALALAVALLVTQNNPFVDKDAAPGASAAAPAAPVAAPTYAFDEAPPEAPGGDAPAGPGLFLQAGAFANAADADALKARLALLGFEASIVSAQEGETTLAKVRLGPYQSLDELNAARARLSQDGVPTMLVKAAPQ